jgi:hypothetical protein
MLGKWTCHVRVRTFAGPLRTADSIECTWDLLIASESMVEMVSR